MQQIASHHKRERMVDLLNSNDETQAVDGYVQIKKVANLNKSRINDFQCQAYFHDQIFDFQLSQVFQTTRFAVLFFCSYDFTQQSKDDLRHIEQNYSKFVQYGALPIAITHDRAQIHLAYATPGKTVASLNFKPSFLLASDGMNKLISTSFKAINMETLTMIRTVIIIDSNMNVIFTYRVPQYRYFPMKSILSCFE